LNTSSAGGYTGPAARSSATNFSSFLKYGLLNSASSTFCQSAGSCSRSDGTFSAAFGLAGGGAFVLVTAGLASWGASFFFVAVFFVAIVEESSWDSGASSSESPSSSTPTRGHRSLNRHSVQAGSWNVQV